MFTAGGVFIAIVAENAGRFSGNPKLFSRTRVEDQHQLFAALRDTPWFYVILRDFAFNRKGCSRLQEP